MIWEKIDKENNATYPAMSVILSRKIFHKNVESEVSLLSIGHYVQEYFHQYTTYIIFLDQKLLYMSFLYNI